MKLSLEEFINLSVDEKIKVLKKNRIYMHPYLWMLLKDSLINSVSTVYWVARGNNEANPPQAISPEDAKKIIDRCEQFNVNLLKIQDAGLISEKKG